MDESRSLPNSLPPNSGPKTYPYTQEQEALLVGLMADARRLAYSRIQCQAWDHPEYRLMCLGCDTMQSPRVALAVLHKPGCPVGAVITRLEAIRKSTSSPSPAAVLPAAAAPLAGPAGRSFEIEAGPEGCWLLRLYENGKEAGGGQFPEDDYCYAVDEGEAFCRATAEPAAPPAGPVDQADGFGEPFRLVVGAYITVENRDGRLIVDMTGSDLPKEDELRFARRLAACVNFCAGLTTEGLEERVATRTARIMAAGIPIAEELLSQSRVGIEAFLAGNAPAAVIALDQHGHATSIDLGRGMEGGAR